MKEAGVDLGQCYAATGRAVDSQHHFIPTGRRRIARAKARRDEAIGSAHICGAESKTDRVRGTTGEHAGAVEGIDAHTVEGGIVAKQVHRQEIGVLSRASARVPQGELGVIAQVGWVTWINLYGIQEPSAGDGVGRLRHTDALPE